jgi:hypothetical protein
VTTQKITPSSSSTLKRKSGGESDENQSTLTPNDSAADNASSEEASVSDSGEEDDKPADDSETGPGKPEVAPEKEVVEPAEEDSGDPELAGALFTEASHHWWSHSV